MCAGGTRLESGGVRAGLSGRRHRPIGGRAGARPRLEAHVLFGKRMANAEKYAGGRGAAPTGMTRKEKRNSGRVRCAKVRSSLGEVQDLSATGVRIACRKKPKLEVGVVVRFELSTDEHAVMVPATVMWVRVQQDCTFHIGLRFEEMDPLRKRKVMDVVRTGIDSEGLTRGWAPIAESGKAKTG